MSTHHRFTGRELSTLLEQVRDELGPEATILEANKVLTGGVAGFFKTEQFEVIATTDEPGIELDIDGGPSTIRLDLIEADGSPAPEFSVGGRPRPEPSRTESVDEAVAAVMSEAPTRHHRLFPDDDELDIRMFESPAHMTNRPDLDTGAHSGGDRTALLDRADTISIDDRIGISLPLDAPDLDDRTTERRFGDILAEELIQTESEPTSRADDAEVFWGRLDALDSLVPTLDLESPIVAVVGRRSSALAVARRLMAEDADRPSALAAVTADPRDIDVAAWQLIDTMTELDDRLRFWQQADRTGILVIDADLGDDAARTVDRVRSAGARVLRLTIDEALTPERIFSLIEKLGGNVVIDLTFRATPDHVLDLLGRGVPLASVGGRRVDLGFVAALQQVAHRG